MNIGRENRWAGKDFYRASRRNASCGTGRLSQLFVDAWLAHRPKGRVILCDLAADPPPHVMQAWIAAALTPPHQHDVATQTTLLPGQTRRLSSLRQPS
jgi:FMN-dependent NADH-azoreductase